MKITELKYQRNWIDYAKLGKIVALIEVNFWANSRDLGPYFQS